MILERANAAQARRRGEPDTLCQFDVGDAPVALKLGEQPPVDLVQICHNDPPMPAR